MIHPTAVVGSPPEHRDWKPGDHMYLPVVDIDAKVNAFVTIDSGLHGPTRLGKSFAMAHCHIGHDAQVGDGCELAPGTVIGGHAVLEDGVRCGIGVLVKPYVRVGKGARIGMGAVVTRDVPAGETWIGNPARKMGTKLKATRVEFTAPVLTPTEEQGWEQYAEAFR